MANLPAAGPIEIAILPAIDEYKTDQVAGLFADQFVGFFTD